uniref:ribosomal protein L33 n=1 Tax=Zantedeschia elliottiana TaxID=94108 RepID=UPI002A7EEE58|nr:ribosomal protein L33 [Zantedeschia elliottiana]WNZ34219.1 ribosomal protein L33 [Zantedeschia elliottiana]
MKKEKNVRVRVILECTSCVRNGVIKEFSGISRYITEKNQYNTPLELKKFCRYCKKHTTHEEVKK